MVHLVGTVALLRSHVVWSPHALSGSSECVISHLISRRCPRDFTTGNQFRDAKVDHFDPALAVEENIRGFDIAMNDPMIVGELERITNLRDDRESFARRDSATRQ